MIRLYLWTLVLVAGCGSDVPATNSLCRTCPTNADCAGNICFADASGGHFCGAPCEACPEGFDCQPLAGSDGTVVKTCFPMNASCATTPVNQDMGTGGGGGGGPMGDLAF